MIDLPEHIVSRRWDAVVVGAGPGGSFAAREIARRGRSVLLVEKTRFPRWKVCGACLGRAGVTTLERAGLGGMLAQAGARPVERTRLIWRGRSVTIPMRGMVALSRGALDTALVREAQHAGVVFLDGARASWSSDGDLWVNDTRVETRSVVLAGGLRTAEPDGSGGAWVEGGSWIGLGVSAASESRESGREAGELTMVVGAGGYVGMVRTEDGMVNWAAAVDPALIRERGSPAEAVRALCAEAGVDLGVPHAGWVGTPALTRRTPAQSGRIYRVGDAAGYVEPITGEGMSWALLGAARLAPILDRALEVNRHPQAWARAHARMFRVRRARCRAVARTLRSPLAMRVGMGVLGSEHSPRSAVVGRLIGGHG